MSLTIDHSGRRALVTGAASGIGRAVCASLAGAGAQVVAVDRDADGLASLAAQIEGLETATCDLSDLDAVQQLPTDIDILVNNAGVTVERGWWWDDPDPLRVLRVNLETPVEMVRLVLPEMKARRSGHIVNIGSVAGRAATNGMYSASKFGASAWGCGANCWARASA